MNEKSSDDALEHVPSIGHFLHSVECALKEGEWAQVRELCEPVLEKLPDCPEALFALALASVHDFDLAGAASLAHRAFAVDPNVQEYADLLAVAYGLAGDLNTSVYYAKLATAIPSSPPLRECIPTSFPTFAHVLQTISEKPLFRRAANALVAKEWVEAEHWLRQHLVFDPASREVYLALGNCLLAQGMPRAAVETLRAGQHQLPLDPGIASLLAKALGALGLFDEVRGLPSMGAGASAGQRRDQRGATRAKAVRSKVRIRPDSGSVSGMGPQVRDQEQAGPRHLPVDRRRSADSGLLGGRARWIPDAGGVGGSSVAPG